MIEDKKSNFRLALRNKVVFTNYRKIERNTDKFEQAQACKNRNKFELSLVLYNENMFHARVKNLF